MENLIRYISGIAVSDYGIKLSVLPCSVYFYQHSRNIIFWKKSKVPCIRPDRSSYSYWTFRQKGEKLLKLWRKHLLKIPLKLEVFPIYFLFTARKFFISKKRNNKKKTQPSRFKDFIFILLKMVLLYLI